MSTTAFAAQSLGAGETTELRVILVRGFIVAAVIGVALILLQVPLISVLLAAMGGSEAVTGAAKTYFSIRIWSAPVVLINYVVLGWLIGLAHVKHATDRPEIELAVEVRKQFVVARTLPAQRLAQRVRLHLDQKKSLLTEIMFSRGGFELGGR